MERTLAILKPDCVSAGKMGKVLARIEAAGFRILAMKMVRLTPETAGKFYEVHKERPFYKDLVSFMCSDRVVPLALEKENAVADFRKLIGATDPAQAEPGTIRKDFATSKQNNIVHGSDSPENGRLEVAFFFSEKELLETM
ncbi:MAG: nucleoside-diphosphate kinase [candidate division KSB1 bacterium]|nr:nucleoside-diphosphate kinase [candidate division KSB1 bacterium]MDZ7272471.1 nucleoside-diphosphate kinase [candidate division KSB1 bacterium]MDZ7284505.1 nucleoside-diphosphate kinase [candidate division KSB1 bacterium]MDZ7297099.1 nucleoside-diphosphate kinase [candidate division KSB1 bacterium]MDZ7306139.1 nucleoside-diphosphate kinase [candidate division KSB1 bacterium]